MEGIMSTDPTGVSDQEFQPKQYIGMKLEKKDWCLFEGECKVDDSLYQDEFLCMLCEHRKMLNIPKRLEKGLEK
jgi:hypothetical protein